MLAYVEHSTDIGRYDYPTFLVTALGIVAVALVASVL